MTGSIVEHHAEEVRALRAKVDRLELAIARLEDQAVRSIELSGQVRIQTLGLDHLKARFDSVAAITRWLANLVLLVGTVYVIHQAIRFFGL